VGTVFGAIAGKRVSLSESFNLLIAKTVALITLMADRDEHGPDPDWSQILTFFIRSELDWDLVLDWNGAGL